jgi:hypothetical protein
MSENDIEICKAGNIGNNTTIPRQSEIEGGDGARDRKA